MARRPGLADQTLARVMLEEYPDEAVRLVEATADAESAELLARDGGTAGMGVIRRLTPDRAARILAALPDDVMRRVVAALNPNRAAALFARMDDEERERCLSVVDESFATSPHTPQRPPAR
jgi:Mg/Co/Ni transporter MgtE